MIIKLCVFVCVCVRVCVCARARVCVCVCVKIFLVLCSIAMINKCDKRHQTMLWFCVELELCFCVFIRFDKVTLNKNINLCHI